MAIKMDAAAMHAIYDDFAAGRKLKDEIYVEFSDINNIDTLVILRAMGKEPDADEIAAIAELMLDGKTITFKHGDDVIESCVYNKGSGNKLHLMETFHSKPYLYDILQQSVYALMLKKLTPHLEGSN